MISIRSYGETPEGIPVAEYSLSNGRGVEVKVMTYGCTITSLRVPDREGNSDDIVLGHDSLDDYRSSAHYFGSLIGRFANRIANGRFILDGHTYDLAKNFFPHHLHGGTKGFDKVVWQSNAYETEKGEGLEFYYLSYDGEEGYPGNVHLRIRYFLNHEDELTLEYLATTDKKTIINLTQHTYFNLNGGTENIFDHELLLHANRFLPSDRTLIPTGEFAYVKDTPFDFMSPRRIGSGIDGNDEQLHNACGYDHTWILDKEANASAHAATLYDPSSGRVLEVYTTEPGLQLYTGNFLDNVVPGKNSTVYKPYSGLCLETQHFPDSPHHPGFPSVELNPGEEYRSETVWKFSTRAHPFVRRET